MSLDPYKVLGVDKKANAEAIKSAYRKLARQYHPDVNPGDKAAEERFKEISEAYDILSDPAKKSEYDNLGREAFYERGFGGAGYQRPDFSGAAFSFEDLFGELFGGARAASGRRGSSGAAGGFSFDGAFGGRPQPQRGEDAKLNLSISLKEAAFGTEAKLELGVPSACPKCQGQGLLAAGGGVRPCPDCGGRGQVTQLENLKVKIPAGIKDGQRVRLKGKGSPGRHGGLAGDLLVEVQIKPDPIFTRKDRDLQRDLPVSLYEALLGGSVEVPTLSGRAALKIPAGTQNGARMRLKGQGMPETKKDKAGDLYVTVRVVLPTALSEEAKSLTSQLARLAPVNLGGAR